MIPHESKSRSTQAETTQASEPAAAAGTREALSRLLDALPVGVVVSGPQDEIRFVNRAARDLLGLGSAPPPDTWAELVPHATREDGTRVAAHDLPGPRARASGQPVRGASLGLARTAGGKRAWVLADAAPVTGPDGAVIQVLSTLCDAAAQHTADTRELPVTRPTATQAIAPLEGDPPRVLVVDDNSVNLKATAAMLESLGYAVDVAATGVDAVDACARLPYDAVLMDCQMPEMDGFKATAFIRQREGPGERVPIIAVTASILPSEREKCLAAGMDDFIGKPTALRQLDEMLRRWTGRPAAETAGAAVLPPDHPLRALETNGQGVLVAEIFGTFIETTPGYVREMRAAHGRGDHAQLVSLAHSLKGAAVQIGAEDVAVLCVRLQVAGRAGDLESAAPLLGALDQAFERVREVLEPLRVRLTSGGRPR